MCEDRPGLRYREIAAGDVAGLIRLRTQVTENALSLEQLTEYGITEDTVIARLQTTHRGWLCEQGGRAVGFAIGNIVDGEMWVVTVLPEHERQGIGGRLMRQVQDWLFTRHDTLWLTTEDRPANRAYGFYEHLGWRKVSSDGAHCRFELRRAP